jgi:hypothetical protein
MILKVHSSNSKSPHALICIISISKNLDCPEKDDLCPFHEEFCSEWI